MPLPTRQTIAGYFPRGNSLPDDDWQRRHLLVLWVLAVHVPGLVVFGLTLGWGLRGSALAAVVPAVCLGLGWVLRGHRRPASAFATLGLVSTSATLVVLTHGMIEAHFHFFIIIGFIALYQDWLPFLLNIAFTVLSHGIGSALFGSIIFNHHAAQHNPWLWSVVHGIAVLCACSATMVFWRINEEQQEQHATAQELAASDMARRKFTGDLLINLARRNQGLLYRQSDIIDTLEESERDPDTLAQLFRLDHLTTRVRRNAESLLVLSGEQTPRVWSAPVPLRDVVWAAIAETEDLNRVGFHIDEQAAVLGHTVTDLTHMIAELIENAVRFSPPDTSVDIRSRPDRSERGGQVLTIEDTGVGIPAADLAVANELLAHPPEVDLSVAKRLGLHVIARLAARHGIRVALVDTPGSGITAQVGIPAAVFATPPPWSTAGDVERTGRTPAVPAQRMSQEALPTRRRQPEVPGRVGAGAPAGRSAVVDPAGGWVTPAPFGIGGELWPGWWESTSDGTGDPLAPPGPPTSPPPPPAPAAPTAPPTQAARPTPTASPAPASPTSHISRTPVPPAPAAPSTYAAWPTPAAPPAPAAPPPPQAPPAPAASPAPPSSLRRREPQASLAPELREPPAEATSFGWDPDRAANAATALSRFQASRDAARTGNGDAG